MRKKLLTHLLQSAGLLIGIWVVAPVYAQVRPDATLPINSIVDDPACSPCDITGGSSQGTNLFHSFSEFSIPTGGSVLFDEATNIENIFSRVTGSFVSTIDGSISTNDANLLIINPNGVVFGDQAALDVNGSFLFTSAESVNFSDGTQFSAIPSQTPSLLTVTAPEGLGFGAAPGPITSEFSILEVFNNQTFALAGGEISLIGTQVLLDEGRAEIASVGGGNTVTIRPFSGGWRLDYAGVESFDDISLSAEAVIEAGGDRGGDIQVYGRNINLSEGAGLFTFATASQAGNLVVNASESIDLNTSSANFATGFFNEVSGTASGEEAVISVVAPRILLSDAAEISAPTFGSGQAPSVKLKATELIEIEGIDDFGFQSTVSSVVRDGASGNGGLVEIDTDRLNIQRGGRATTSTFGEGDAGTLLVRAGDVTIRGTVLNSDPSLPSGLFSQVNENAGGNGGQLTLIANNLTVEEGAQISTGTANGTKGQGGAIFIDVAETIRLNGSADNAIPTLGRSGIFVSADLGSTGPAGSLELEAARLVVENGANISADNIGSSASQNATIINVDQLIVQSGGRIGAGSILGSLPDGSPGNGGTGPGGTLTINAAESVTVSGTGTVGTSTVISSLTTVAEGSGNGGNLRVFTPRLTIENRGEVSASASAQGAAGNIFLIIPEQLNVNDADIRTDSQQSAGGGIEIEGGSIILTNDGDIRTNVASGVANGGTILIEADALVALDDSDILAFAQDGAGGNITLPAFFTQNLDSISSDAAPDTLDGNNQVDVNATGQLASGIITFPDVSFIENSLSELPDAPIDTDTLVASSCIAPVAQGRGRLVLTGADGIPQQPGSTGIAAVSTGEVRPLSAAVSADDRAEAESDWQIGDPIVEPQAVYQVGSDRLVLSRDC